MKMKHFFILFCGIHLNLLLYAQLPIAGQTIDIPETKIDIYNKPIIWEDYLPYFSVTRNSLDRCIPRGEKIYFCKDIEECFYIDADTIRCGMPRGYYTIDAIVHSAEEIMFLKDFPAIKGKNVIEYWISRLPSNETLHNFKAAGKQSLYDNYYATKGRDAIVYILTDVKGTRKYYYRWTEDKDYLFIPFYDSVVKEYKNSDCSFLFKPFQGYPERYENYVPVDAVRDFYTGKTVPVRGKVFRCKDVIVNTEKRPDIHYRWSGSDKKNRINLIAILVDPENGNQFSYELLETGLGLDLIEGPLYGIKYCELYTKRAIEEFRRRTSISTSTNNTRTR